MQYEKGRGESRWGYYRLVVAYAKHDYEQQEHRIEDEEKLRILHEHVDYGLVESWYKQPVEGNELRED